MRSRSFIIVAASLVVLLAGAAGVFAYDRGGRELIPEGVSVAGVYVGGLDAAGAREKLQREFLGRLRTPVRVYHDKKTFTLGPRESRIAADLDGMVHAAVAEARDGNMFTRTWRRLTGAKVEVAIPPRVTYSKEAALRLVDRVRAAVDRDPQDAKVSFTAGGLDVQESRIGLEVLASELHRKVRAAIVDPEADHTIVARTRHVEPEKTSEEIHREYATALIVDRGSYALRLYKDLALVKTYPIAVGAIGRETPAGLYSIANKAVNPAWTKPHSDWVPVAERGEVVPGGVPENPLKARWLGIYDGVGIHGTADDASIGSNASKGCIRMHVPHVIELFDRVPVGTPVYIA